MQPIDDRSQLRRQRSVCGETPFTGAACNGVCATNVKELSKIYLESALHRTVEALQQGTLFLDRPGVCQCIKTRVILVCLFVDINKY